MASLISVLFAALMLMLAFNSLRAPAPRTQVVYVELPQRSTRRSPGCFAWLVGFVLLIVALLMVVGAL